MTAVPLPQEFGFGFVVGRMLEIVADQPNSTDPYPDGKPVQLSKAVVFTPAVPTRVTQTPGLPEPSIAFLQDPIAADLDAYGYLSVNGLHGVWLYTGLWNVTFRNELGWKPFQINITANYTLTTPLDLFASDPYVPPAGVAVTTLQVATTVNDGDVLIRQGSTLIGVDPNNFKTDVSGLARVATSGSYADLLDSPALSKVAGSGQYSDLNGLPNLAAVASSGSYSDLSDTPTLGSAAGASVDDFAPYSFYGVSSESGNTATVGPDGKIYVPTPSGSAAAPAYDPTADASAGLVSWHKYDSGVNADTSTPAKVLTWTGKTASANVFTSTSGKEPYLTKTFVNGGYVYAPRSINYHPSVMTSNIVPATANNPSTMLCVFEDVSQYNGAGWQWVCGYGNPSTGQMRNIGSKMNNAYITGFSFNGGDYYGPVVGPDRYIAIGVWDGTTITYYVNGIAYFSIARAALSTANTGMVLFDGPSKTEASTCTILELITWSRALSLAEIENANAKLKAFYGTR